eukprot:TRINITY_DN5080_c0_g1_i1.p1 TRINITY_DN5080_c0_g1~~TRINITY_DN5080_c0_g1_i1.p1  ORF type:complete len:274 (-),score=91.63 TRINITY_DN5080_c0_g1_i1:210-1031(-)
MCIRDSTMADDSATDLSLKACQLDAEGDSEQAAQMHVEAAQSAPQNPSVQAAMASHFIREHLPAVQGDQDLCQLVASGFAVAIAADSAPLGEYAVFLSKVTQDSEGALKAFLEALAESPDDADLRYNYGNFLDQAMGQPDQAAAEYERALIADPEHGPTLNNYAALLVEQARDGADMLGKAQKLLLRAEELAPGFPAYNLACIACLMQNAQECEHWLRTAYSTAVFEGLPAAEELMEDDDLAAVSGDAWFVGLLEEIRRAHESGEPLLEAMQE